MLYAPRMKLSFSTFPLFNVCQSTWTCAHTIHIHTCTHACTHTCCRANAANWNAEDQSARHGPERPQSTLSQFFPRCHLDYLLHFHTVAMKPLKSILIFKQYGAQINKPNRSGVQSRCSSLGLRNVTPLCFEGNQAD